MHCPLLEQQLQFAVDLVKAPSWALATGLCFPLHVSAHGLLHKPINS